ncbi:MAG: asparagine synthase-related protein [Ignavibacteria bacterium]
MDKDFVCLGGIEPRERQLKKQSGTRLSREGYNGDAITSISRIYNKEELFHKLSVPHHQRQSLSDNQIFMKCFKKWKYECPKYIIGEWVFAIWNNVEKELFITTSHYDGPNLYYCNIGETFYFSNSLKALLALDNIPKEINDLRVAQFLTGWQNSDENFYKSINRLGAAHSIRISANKFEIKRYWALEEAPPIRFKTDSEYVEAFKELYTEAVKCRVAVGKNVGSMLSGGLDSGSVSALAAMELKKQGKILQAFSSVPAFDVSASNINTAGLKNYFLDETDCINATAGYNGNIDVNFIKSKNLSPLKALKKYLQMFEEPVGITKNLYWQISMNECAKTKEIDILLNGRRGNITVSWKGFFTGIMDWYAFLERVKNGHVTDYRNILGAAKTHLIVPAIPNVIYKQIKERQNLQLRLNDFSIINNAFAKTQNLTGHLKENIYVEQGNPRDFQISFLNPLYGVLPFSAELDRFYSLWSTDPTADKRILEFCTSIPNNQFYRKGTKKYLFKRAMKGILPDKVLYNSRKGLQAADFQQRLIQDLPEIKSILESLKKSEICNHYLDVKKIESALPLIRQNNYMGFKYSINILFKGIAFGLFLKKFE